ncbi:hypothetical protein ACH5RR_023717 [Cinchona calisaya]|uniref:Uncharacterized protein n=1 Tax=Cinchona calisaya TaxID=153742 RepID=A0ABD2ZBF4_9GENT
MAMRLGRNLGKYLTTTSPAGFGGSSMVRRGGSGTAMALQPPCQFSSWMPPTPEGGRIHRLVKSMRDEYTQTYIVTFFGSVVACYLIAKDRLSYIEHGMDGKNRGSA